MTIKNILLRLILVAAAVVSAGCGGGSSAPGPDSQADKPGLLVKPEAPKGASMFEDASIDYSWDLIAGQNQNAGTVRVYNSATTLYVAYNLTGGFMMSEAHVYVGSTPPDAKGAPGQFPYGKNFSPTVSSYTFEIPLSGLNAKSRIYVAAHAAANGETLWGGRWNNGAPTYQYKWSKKWGGYFSTNVMPVFAAVTDWKSYTAGHYGAESYWGINFADQSWYTFPGSNTWAGWCVDLAHSMYPGSPYNVQVYSCYDPALPAFAQSGNWDMISYMITKRNNSSSAPYNQDWTSNAVKDQFQTAIWYFKGGGGYPASGSLAEQLVLDAMANGDGFIPGSGEYYAVILFPDTSTDNNAVRAQMNIIEVDP